ncbi:MAG: hypothetical protein JNM42_00730 [Propionivibrio sp.]|uniref:hypothetical protein n=1 Tax=Propionivibrio sp. TaxID=2212460 RepID=UPI001A624B92|nr:hypothetical protein [Propionivibrio sp.]MBL8412946.1 hypothetical protein [Propionivibrio sp.]
MHEILSKLDGGDRRSIGRSNEVVAEVLADPGLFDAVFSGLLSASPIIRMRSADAIEKISARRPEHLLPYKNLLVERISRSDQKEVRWHVAQMLPRIEWTRDERQQVLGVLLDYLNDTSSIVKTFAMQALADLARQAPEMRPAARVHLRDLTVRGTPAMKSRGRKLLDEMESPSEVPENPPGLS